MPPRTRHAEDIEYRLRNDIPDRPGIWHICYSDPLSRRSKKISTGQRNETAAREWRRQWIADRNAPPSYEAQTVSLLLDAYLLDRKGSVHAYQRLVDACVPLRARLGAMVPGEIDDEAITAYRRHRADCSDWTIRKELTTLRAALNYGRKIGWLESAPIIDLGAKPPARARWLRTHEAQALLEASHSTLHVWLFILLALNTGARKGAILALTWDRVDFDTGRLDFKEPDRPETSKRRTTVPMNETLRAALLEARDAAQSNYVIEWNGARVGDVKTAMRKAARRAGLAEVSAHTLKHTCVSWLAQSGISMEDAASLTATDPSTLREVYRHHDPDYLSGATNALDSIVRQMVHYPAQRGLKGQKKPNGCNG